MSTCGSCSALLDPAWKYCIHCGTPTGRPAIPAAIRPDPDGSTTDADERLERRLAFIVVGTICFLIGVALFAFSLIAVLEYFR